MKNLLTLNNLTQGQSATVAMIKPESNIYRRLLDIGLIEGTRIECVQHSPGGDPIAYLIRGAVIALRQEDSNNIIVSC